MNLNFTALVFPLALLLMALEYWISQKTNKQTYRFGSTISNLSVGIAERLLDMVLHGSFYFVFNYVYDHFALFRIPNTWYVWVTLVFLTDFIWYWYHRVGHEVNLFWAFHIVHHQSEEYNFSVAARITNLQSLVRNLFWCVLPLLGISPVMTSIVLIIHGTYSFFTHTQLVKKLGWLEHVFITPSLHGVHHASNPEYLDKNYGDIFVFWDKLFGTFRKEEGKPTFGLTTPLKSYSFLWQHFHYLAEVLYRVSLSKGCWEKVCVLVGKPNVMQGNEREILERKLFLKRKNKLRFSGNNYKKYVLAQTCSVFVVSFLLILFSESLAALSLLLGIFFTILTLINCGALLEQRRWIVLVEYLRLFVVFFAVAFYVDNGLCYVFFLTLSFCIVLSYSYIKENYLKLVFEGSC